MASSTDSKSLVANGIDHYVVSTVYENGTCAAEKKSPVSAAWHSLIAPTQLSWLA